MPLHVSSNKCSPSGGPNCINTSSDITLWWVTFWRAGQDARSTKYKVKTQHSWRNWRPGNSDNFLKLHTKPSVGEDANSKAHIECSSINLGPVGLDRYTERKLSERRNLFLGYWLHNAVPPPDPNTSPPQFISFFFFSGWPRVETELLLHGCW
jgi:hypothetical protein